MNKNRPVCAKSHLPKNTYSGIKRNWWFVFLISLFVGPLYGFRCRCVASEGKIRDVYTVGWIFLPEGRTGPLMDVFSPLHPRFDLVVAHEGLPPETEIRVSWYHLENENEIASGKRLFHVRPQVVEGTGSAFFSAPGRGRIWPGGKYAAIVERDGKKAGKARFRVFAEERIRMRLYKAGEPVPEHSDVALLETETVFSGKDDTIGLMVEAANPGQGATLRIMWHRQTGEGDFTFYSESDEVFLRNSQRLHFVMPKVEKGYCGGVYRVSALLGDKTVERKVFSIRE